MERARQAQPLLVQRHMLTKEFEQLQLELLVDGIHTDIRYRMYEIFVQQCTLDQELLKIIPESCQTAFIVN